MEVMAWLILGGLAGWVSSIILGTDADQGALTNILLGLIGAVFGGLLVNFLTEPTMSGPTLTSFAISLMGAASLIGIARLIYR